MSVSLATPIESDYFRATRTVYTPEMAMTFNELQAELHTLRCTCDINQRYHQSLAWWWKLGDRTLKIVVALVATAALAAEFGGETFHHLAIWLSAVAAVLAVVLNVVPLGEIEKFYDELFRSWSELRTDIETLIVKNHDNYSDSKVPTHLHERLAEMRAKQFALNSREPDPYRRLLEKCQEDSNQSIWGPGIRTTEEVEAERAKREKAYTSSKVISEGGAAEPAE